MNAPDLKPRKHPSWIDAFVEYTKDAPSPHNFRKWAGISAIAGALERRCWIHTAAAKLYPNMFILLVAPPGVGKDFAINPMKDLWNSTGKFNLAPIAMTHKGLVDALSEETAHKQYVQDGEWNSYHSLLVAVPELGVLVPGHDLAFLSTLNELYNCGDVYEERSRMSKETLRIERPHLHIISGTQPKYLGELFPEAAYGMGFTSRIIMIYAGTPVRVSLFQDRDCQKHLRLSLRDDLTQIEKLRGPFTITNEAQALIEHWHLAGCESDKPSHGKLIHYNARRIMHLLKLCMVFSVSRTAALVIEPEDFHNALHTLLEAETDMPEIFKEISSGGQISEIEEAFHFILRLYNRSKKPVGEHRLIHFLSSRVPTNQINFIVDTMIRSKMIKQETKGQLNLPVADRLFIPQALNQI